MLLFEMKVLLVLIAFKIKLFLIFLFPSYYLEAKII